MLSLAKRLGCLLCVIRKSSLFLRTDHIQQRLLHNHQHYAPKQPTECQHISNNQRFWVAQGNNFNPPKRLKQIQLRTPGQNHGSLPNIKKNKQANIDPHSDRSWPIPMVMLANPQVDQNWSKTTILPYMGKLVRIKYWFILKWGPYRFLVPMASKCAWSQKFSTVWLSMNTVTNFISLSIC